MNTEIFTVYDSAARRYLEPFCAETIETAIRMFRALVEKEGHSFNRWPQDYTLFHIGKFDSENGVLIALDTPHSLGVAITFVPRQLEAV